MSKLLPRIRKRTKSTTTDVSSSLDSTTQPAATSYAPTPPSASLWLSESGTEYSPVEPSLYTQTSVDVERRIHHDLNALAEELDSQEGKTEIAHSRRSQVSLTGLRPAKVFTKNSAVFSLSRSSVESQNHGQSTLASTSKIDTSAPEPAPSPSEHRRHHRRWATFGRENRKSSAAQAENVWASSSSPTHVSRTSLPPSAYVSPHSMPASQNPSASASRSSSISYVTASPSRRSSTGAVHSGAQGSPKISFPPILLTRSSTANTAPSSKSRSSGSSRSKSRTSRAPAAPSSSLPPQTPTRDQLRAPAVQVTPSQASGKPSTINSDFTFGQPLPGHARTSSFTPVVDALPEHHRPPDIHISAISTTSVMDSPTSMTTHSTSTNTASSDSPTKTTHSEHGGTFPRTVLTRIASAVGGPPFASASAGSLPEHDVTSTHDHHEHLHQDLLPFPMQVSGSSSGGGGGDGGKSGTRSESVGETTGVAEPRVNRVPDWEEAAREVSPSRIPPLLSPPPQAESPTPFDGGAHPDRPRDDTHALFSASVLQEEAEEQAQRAIAIAGSSMVTSSAPISPGSGSSRQRTATASPPSTPLQAIFKPPSPSPQNGSFPPSPSPLQKSFEGAAGATSLPRRQSATRVQSPLRPGVLRSTTDPNATPANKGKRKADDDIERTPPEERERKEKQRTTFAPDPRVQRISNTDSSHAPSSYHRKRPRVSNQTASSSSSRPAITEHPSRDGSWTSRSSAPPNAIRPPSRTKSTRSDRRAMSPAAPADEREDSRSGVSIPISALISPHAPSIVSTPGQRSSYHMRDPRRPRVRPTPWALSFGAGEDGLGSPVQAWMFFIGFILFPLWWLASVWRIPETRSVGGHDAAEKAVVVDDPQIEHDARTWRFRCRIMAAISLVTYIPFIVLVAIFAPR